MQEPWTDDAHNQSEKMISVMKSLCHEIPASTNYFSIDAIENRSKWKKHTSMD